MHEVICYPILLVACSDPHFMNTDTLPLCLTVIGCWGRGQCEESLAASPRGGDAWTSWSPCTTGCAAPRPGGARDCGSDTSQGESGPGPERSKPGDQS